VTPRRVDLYVDGSVECFLPDGRYQLSTKYRTRTVVYSTHINTAKLPSESEHHRRPHSGRFITFKRYVMLRGALSIVVLLQFFERSRKTKNFDDDENDP